MLKTIEKLLDSNFGLVCGKKADHAALVAILAIIQEEVDQDYKPRSKHEPKYCAGCHKELAQATKGKYCRECQTQRSRTRVCPTCGEEKTLNLFDGDSSICWKCKILGE